MERPSATAPSASSMSPAPSTTNPAIARVPATASGQYTPVNGEVATRTNRIDWTTTQVSPRSARSGEGDDPEVEAFSTESLDELVGRLAVDRERHESLAAAAAAGDRHVRDVHAGFAEHRPDPPDHAGPVVVPDEDHQRRELHLDLESERADEPMPVVAPDRRSGDAHLLALACDLDADQVREVARGAAPFLEDLDAALGRDQRRVDVVDRLLGAALKGTVERGDRQQARVARRERAVVRERDPLAAAAGQLHREPAELRRERNERAEHLELLGANGRDVDRVR